jgi:predicted secreted protein
MPTTAKTGIGLQLKRGLGNTPVETFNAIAMVKSIKGPSEEASTIDVTSLDSTGGYAEFIQGLKTGGQLVAEANFDPADATYLLIRADFQNAVTHNYQISGSPWASVKFSFAAFPIKLDHSMEPRAANTVSITLQITGNVTLA